MNDKTIEIKPTCAVGGMVAPRAMCSKIIVGGKYCGHAGEREHKRVAQEWPQEVQSDGSVLPVDPADMTGGAL